jgi:FXSXX-COOH protein
MARPSGTGRKTRRAEHVKTVMEGACGTKIGFVDRIINRSSGCPPSSSRGVPSGVMSKGDHFVRDAREEIESELIDLSALPLERLPSLGGTVLAAALQRMRAEALNPGVTVAGFDNMI